MESKNWVFTINNYTDADIAAMALWTTKYLIYGKEICPTTSTPHLQGYAIFTTNKKLNALKKLQARAHWEIRRGSHSEASEYCKKEKDFTQTGTPPTTPQEKGAIEKRRWDDAFSAAKEGRLDDIPSDIRMRYYSTIKRIKIDYFVKKQDVDGTCGVWLWGRSGVGKSKKAREDYPGAYDKPCNKWWDGYQDEDYVIIDDFDISHSVLGHHLKLWADRYSFIAEVKGVLLIFVQKR
jgi:RNA helicase./Putative viral replication protein.